MIKSLIWLILLTLVISACTPTYNFRSPNDVNETDCTLFLTDGTQKSGKITIQFENARNIDISSNIRLNVNTGVEEIIPFYKILYYEINQIKYFPKKFDLSSGFELPEQSLNNLYESGKENYLFIKLLSPLDAKMQLFELQLSHVNSTDGLDHYKYFISFKNEDRYKTWYIGSNKFFPSFEDKMSNLVSECPELAQKIKSKQKGYYLTHMSFETYWLFVFKKITSEYYNCK